MEVNSNPGKKIPREGTFKLEDEDLDNYMKSIKEFLEDRRPEVEKPCWEAILQLRLNQLDLKERK